MNFGIQKSTRKHLQPMKTKPCLMFLLAILISSCSLPKYLPTSESIDLNVYGSFIQVRNKKGRNIKGELIAADSIKIVVLKEKENLCSIVPITDIRSFRLIYAKPKNYKGAWAMLLFVPMHGWFSPITLPINLIVIASVNTNPYKYTNKKIPFEMLNMFARFPQGIPPGIELLSISY